MRKSAQRFTRFLAIKKHRDQLQEQVTAYKNLSEANQGREIQMEKYRNALEAKNTESNNVMETFKRQIIKMKKGNLSSWIWKKN